MLFRINPITISPDSLIYTRLFNPMKHLVNFPTRGYLHWIDVFQWSLVFLLPAARLSRPGRYRSTRTCNSCLGMPSRTVTIPCGSAKVTMDGWDFISHSFVHDGWLMLVYDSALPGLPGLPTWKEMRDTHTQHSTEMIRTKGQSHPLEGFLLVGERTIHQNLLEPRCFAGNLLYLPVHIWGGQICLAMMGVVWKDPDPSSGFSSFSP